MLEVDCVAVVVPSALKEARACGTVVVAHVVVEDSVYRRESDLDVSRGVSSWKVEEIALVVALCV